MSENAQTKSTRLSRIKSASKSVAIRSTHLTMAAGLTAAHPVVISSKGTAKVFNAKLEDVESKAAARAIKRAEKAQRRVDEAQRIQAAAAAAVEQTPEVVEEPKPKTRRTRKTQLEPVPTA